MYQVLTLFTFSCLLCSSIAEYCWSGDLVTRCLERREESTDCSEFMLAQNYLKIVHDGNTYGVDHVVSLCFPCHYTSSDRGLTCQINASTTQGGQRLRAHRALVFIYITRNLQSEVILRFDHIQNGNSYEIPYKLQKTAAGRAGPFFVDAAYQPVVLKRFRCYGACDVEFDTRRPFAFVHYIPE